ncbi:MAG: EamA family transporter [Candidatus Saganbacteria bacterium]|nr:EamA family transporter [Candidatus Saganbacteria bacterium]
MNYLIMAVSVGLAIAGQLLMKRGMISFGTFPVSQLAINVIPMFLNPWVFIGLACFGLSSVFWLVVLSRMELSLVYPMVSVAYVVVALLSWYFFKENLTLVRWAGIAVIVLGVILISRS